LTYLVPAGEQYVTPKQTNDFHYVSTNSTVLRFVQQFRFKRASVNNSKIKYRLVTGSCPLAPEFPFKF